jgi:hypothetical protein
MKTVLREAGLRPMGLPLILSFQPHSRMLPSMEVLF